MSIESMDCCDSSSSSFSPPEDLLIEILLCLPVTTLLRFKSICKSWFTLINSSDFIHRHAITTTLPLDNNNSSSSSSKLGTFIFQSRKYTWNSFEKKYYVSWNIFSNSGDHEFELVYEDLGMPPCYEKPNKSLENYVLMVSSCNGVICLYHDELRDVSLWNPAIHQFKLLPKLLTFTGTGNGKVHRDFVAFGFDPETKDYKVLLVTYFYPLTDGRSYCHSTYPHRVQVYSLSTDSWRPLEDVVLPTYPLPNQRRNHGGYLNGSYYCLGQKWLTSIDELTGNYNHGGVMEVLSFDFTKEIFKTMQLPKEIFKPMQLPDGIGIFMFTRFDNIGIIFLGEKIAIVDHVITDSTYDFWVLNEVEVAVKESWTKLYTIGPYSEFQRPISISNNGEFIFIVTSREEKLWLLNPSTQAMKELQCDGNQIMKAYVYRRSLVPVICSTRNGSTSELSQV